MKQQQIELARAAAKKIRNYIRKKGDLYSGVQVDTNRNRITFTNLDVRWTFAIDLAMTVCPDIQFEAQGVGSVAVIGPKEAKGAKEGELELADPDKIHQALIEDISGLSLNDAAEIIRVIQAIRKGDQEQARKIVAQANETVQLYTKKEWEA